MSARTGSALLPMRLFADRGFSAGLVTQGAFQGALAGFALVLTVYVQAGLGWSADPRRAHPAALQPRGVRRHRRLGAARDEAGQGRDGRRRGPPVGCDRLGAGGRARPRRRPVDVGPRAGAGHLRDRPRAAGRAAGRHRAGDDPDRRGRSRVGRLRDRPAGRRRPRRRDHRDRVLRRRRHVVRRGLAAVRPDRRVLGRGRRHTRSPRWPACCSPPGARCTPTSRPSSRSSPSRSWPTPTRSTPDPERRVVI